MGEKRKNGRKAALIVPAVLGGALGFAGNFLFRYALDPKATFSIKDLFRAGEVEGIGGGAAAELSPERRAWRDHTAAAREWYASEGRQAVLEVRASRRRGKYFPREGRKYAILFHGYVGRAGDMAPYARKFYDMGFSVLVPDALAHGESDGKYIGMGWLERSDVLGWIGFITRTDPNAEIVLHGVSMGGTTVMMAAGEDLPNNVKCAVEDCGYSSAWEEFRVQLKKVFRLPAFPLLHTASLICRLRAGYFFGEASALRQLRKAKVPMLFIHGDADTFVPFEMLDTVFAACASPEKEKLVVRGAAHSAAADTEPVLYWDTVRSFVEKYISD